MLPIGITGQNSIYQSIKKLPLTDVEKAIKIDSLLEKNLKEGDTLNFLIVSHKFANWHYNRNRVAEAIAALSLSIKYHNLDTADLQTKLHKRGYWYSLLNQHDACISDNRTVIDLGPKSFWSTVSYSAIARSLNFKGDYTLAAKNLEIAEERLLKSNDHTGLIDLYTKSYNTYSEISTTEANNKLLTNLKAADSLSKLLNVDNEIKYIVKRALGSYYTSYKTRNIAKGSYHLNQALDIALIAGDSFRITKINNDLGRLYDELDPKKAIAFNETAFLYCPQDEIRMKSIIFGNLGLNYAHLGNFEISINKLQEALKYLTGSPFDTLSLNQKEKLISKNLHDDNLWSILRSVAQTYDLKHEKTKDNKDLDSAIAYYKLTDYAFDQYTAASTLTNSKLLWRQQASETYSRSMRAFAKANSYEDVFYAIEKNKALLLKNETQKIKSLREKQLPLDLAQQERSLQQQLQNTKNSEELPVIIDSLEQIQKEIAKLLPSLGTLEKQSNILPLDSIQKELQPHQALIEYHISTDIDFGIYPNTNVGYGLVIIKDSTALFKLKDLSQLKQSITSLLQKLSTPQHRQTEVTAFQENANQLYGTLFPPEITPLIKSKSLTIIPDNYLSQIPFEVLTVSDTIPNDYLINHHEINYKYSYTFHHSQSKNYPSLANEYTAFAPVAFKDNQLANLQNSSGEIETIASHFDGNSYTNTQATKAAFLNQLGKSNIIHLATHANAADSISPWISFYDQKISLDELSNLQNDASLVVLSACNTTAGEIITGEGTMSLARAFFYGGAQSTVSSLWQIDDKATTSIMNGFYEHLAQGQTKSASLRNAKLEYLKNHSGSEISPYYWSSFILIGDISPIPARSFSLYYVIIGLIAILLLLVLLSRKRKKSID